MYKPWLPIEEAKDPAVLFKWRMDCCGIDNDQVALVLNVRKSTVSKWMKKEKKIPSMAIAWITAYHFACRMEKKAGYNV